MPNPVGACAADAYALARLRKLIDKDSFGGDRQVHGMNRTEGDDMGNEIGDDGTKIAPEDLSQLMDKENPIADDNIDLFLRQRALGNTNRAPGIGKLFVEDLLDCVWTRPPPAWTPTSSSGSSNCCSPTRCTAPSRTNSPNHIVANTALSSFYEHLEDADRSIFSEINESAAFSFYLYLHRAGEESATSIGKTFAKLCGAAEDSDCAFIGESAYARFFSAPAPNGCWAPATPNNPFGKGNGQTTRSLVFFTEKRYNLKRGPTGPCGARDGASRRDGRACRRLRAPPPPDRAGRSAKIPRRRRPRRPSSNSGPTECARAWR